MKILFVGDYSNYHRCLSDALKALGHEVTVASAGSYWLNTARDIDLRRGKSKLGGAWLYLRLLTVLRRRLRGYDMVQLCGPGFIDLKPKRLRRIFDYLRANNGRVMMAALGADSYYVDVETSGHSPLRYDEWHLDNRPSPHALASKALIGQWLNPELVEYTKYVYDNVDGCVDCLYEYHQVYKQAFEGRITYVGIPIDLAKVTERPLPPLGPDDRLRVMLAYQPGRMVEKGTDVLLAMLRRIEARHPRQIEVVEVTGLPYDRFVESIASVHVVVDQLYSYTPATTALLTMAMGRVTVSGAEPEYYDFIGERELRPIIHTDPLDLEWTERNLEQTLLDRALIRTLAAQGRPFVTRHNDSMKVAKELGIRN